MRSQETERDDGRRQCDESAVDIAVAVCPPAQAAEAVQPRNCPLDHPTYDPKAAAMLGEATRYRWPNVPSPEFLTMTVRVIAPVSEQLFGPAPGMTDFAAHPHHGIDQGQQCLDIVAVSAGRLHRQRDSLAVGQHLVLGAQLGAIGRVFRGRLTSSPGADIAAIGDGAGPVDAVGLVQFREQHFAESLPHARALPSLQVVQATHAAPTAHVPRKVFPGNAGLEHEQNTSQHLAQWQRLAAWVAKTAWLRWRQQRFDAMPKGSG